MAGRIYAALRSGKGCVRSGNEDCWYLNGEWPDQDKMDLETARKGLFPDAGSLFAVCDGVGGAQKGEVASWTAVSGMKELQKNLAGSDMDGAVQAWTHNTNLNVDAATHGGGCTLAMVYFRGGKAFVGHIGDSRVYRLHDGKLERVTHDHSKVQMLMDAGIITADEALVHPQRHMIIRSFGMSEDDGPCLCELNAPIPLIAGDRFLICSDGVTDMIPEDRLEDLMRLPGDADNCAEAIYRAALAAGGEDNTTLILLEYQAAETDPALHSGSEAKVSIPMPATSIDDTIFPNFDSDDDDVTIAPESQEDTPTASVPKGNKKTIKWIIAVICVVVVLLSAILLLSPVSGVTGADAASPAPAATSVPTPTAMPAAALEPAVSSEPMASPSPSDLPAETIPEAQPSPDSTHTSVEV